MLSRILLIVFSLVFVHFSPSLAEDLSEAPPNFLNDHDYFGPITRTAVKRYQDYLNKDNLLLFPPPLSDSSGYFGPLTRAAVERYQDNLLLSPPPLDSSGYFGPLTRAELMKIAVKDEGLDFENFQLYDVEGNVISPEEADIIIGGMDGEDFKFDLSEGDIKDFDVQADIKSGEAVVQLPHPTPEPEEGFATGTEEAQRAHDAWKTPSTQVDEDNYVIPGGDTKKIDIKADIGGVSYSDEDGSSSSDTPYREPAIDSGSIIITKDEPNSNTVVDENDINDIKVGKFILTTPRKDIKIEKIQLTIPNRKTQNPEIEAGFPTGTEEPKAEGDLIDLNTPRTPDPNPQEGVVAIAGTGGGNFTDPEGVITGPGWGEPEPGDYWTDPEEDTSGGWVPPDLRPEPKQPTTGTKPKPSTTGGYPHPIGPKPDGTPLGPEDFGEPKTTPEPGPFHEEQQQRLLGEPQETEDRDTNQGTYHVLLGGPKASRLAVRMPGEDPIRPQNREPADGTVAIILQGDFILSNKDTRPLKHRNSDSKVAATIEADGSSHVRLASVSFKDYPTRFVHPYGDSIRIVGGNAVTDEEEAAKLGEDINKALEHPGFQQPDYEIPEAMHTPLDTPDVMTNSIPEPPVEIAPVETIPTVTPDIAVVPTVPEPVSPKGQFLIIEPPQNIPVERSDYPTPSEDMEWCPATGGYVKSVPH